MVKIAYFRQIQETHFYRLNILLLVLIPLENANNVVVLYITHVYFYVNYYFKNKNTTTPLTII